MTENRSLLDLGDDVLTLVALQLGGSASATGSRLPGLSDVLNMSVLCKQMRRAIMPLIFWDVCWPPNRIESVEFYPPSVWPFIRRLSFVRVTWASIHIQALAVLAKTLPQLPNIITFNYSVQNRSPSLPFISSVARFSSSLTTLEISTPFLYHDALQVFATFSGLHRLRIEQPDRTTLFSASETKRAQSIQCVANLVLGCHTSLTYLELPGEFCPLESFISAKTSMPALQTFVVRGYPPLDSQNFPIWKLLRSMPRLSTFQVFCRLRIIGAALHRWVLMPQDAVPAPGEVYLFPSPLETIMISNPSMEDYIFRRLPHSLRHLSLDFIPDWENMLSSGDSLAYHRPERMLGLFKQIRQMAGRSGMIGLQELHIKMGWCVTPMLLSYICQTFPGLRVLELQGLRYFSRGDEAESELDACLAALSHLTHICTLKLALELREDPYESTSGENRKVGSVDQSTARWANALALRLPTLKMVGFEARTHTGRMLGPRVLVGPPTWVWYSLETRRGIGNDKVERAVRPLEQESIHLEEVW